MKALLVSVTLLVLMLFAVPSWATVGTGTGRGGTKATACTSAKAAAAGQCNVLVVGGRVARYEDCDCEEINQMYDKWSCSVDAHCKGGGKSTTASIIPGVEVPLPVVSIQP
jgi:hypothetical protein